MATPPKGLSLLRTLGFSCPSLPVGALAVALPVFLPHYYASHLGLSLTTVGLTFTCIRLADILVDPAIGFAIDRTRWRLGRYRPWMALGLPLYVLAIHQLFMPPAGAGYAYLAGWLLAFYLAMSVLLLAHMAWTAAITPDYDARSRLFGWIQILGVAGACAILAAKDVPTMGWLLIAAGPLGVLLACVSVGEPPLAKDSGERFGLADYGRMLMRPDLRRIVAADFCLQLGPNGMAALYLFYFRDLRGFNAGQANILLFVYVVSGLVGAPLLSWLATRWGKHQTLMVSSTGFSLGLIGLTMLPKANLWAASPFMFVMGVLATSFVILDRAMLADVGDAIRLETGLQRAGLLYALLNSTQKVAGALSIGLTFLILGWLGYDPHEGAVNTPHAIHALAWTFLLGPVIFVMLGGACYLGYDLDARRHGEIRAALAARDAAAGAG